MIDTFTDDAGQTWYTTKGDANEEPDPEPVHPANLIGIVQTDLDRILTIPVLGAVPLGQWVTWTRTIPGMAVLFDPVLVSLILGELRVMFTGLRVPRRRGPAFVASEAAAADRQDQSAAA